MIVINDIVIVYHKLLLVYVCYYGIIFPIRDNFVIVVYNNTNNNNIINYM